MDVTTAPTNGDLATIYRAEAPGLLRLAHVMVANFHEAEEIVQDAFATFAPRIAEIENAAAYLRVCVLNGARQVVRRREQARTKEPLRLASSTVMAVPTELVELADVLQKMSHRKRSAVVLRYLCDLTDRQIGEVLECTPSTVRSLLRRGLAQLRKELS